MKNLEEIIGSINKSRMTLFILCGLPYSGKTHIAREILKHASCVYVSMDFILTELGYDWDLNKLPDEQGWKEVIDISYQRSKKALKDSRNVLYDSTNHTRISRDDLKKIASEVNANVQIIYIDVAPDVVIKRWEQNKITKTRFILNEKLLNMTIDSMEIPTNEERPWILKN